MIVEQLQQQLQQQQQQQPASGRAEGGGGGDDGDDDSGGGGGLDEDLVTDIFERFDYSGNGACENVGRPVFAERGDHLLLFRSSIFFCTGRFHHLPRQARDQIYARRDSEIKKDDRFLSAYNYMP